MPEEKANLSTLLKMGLSILLQPHLGLDSTMDPVAGTRSLLHCD
jgi:hypothetical protein